MTDLSRYDGHTPGPWELDPYDPYEIEDGSGHTSDACDVGWANQEKENWDDEYDGDPLANARLMCDAPLLLEEVRRPEAENRKPRDALGAIVEYECGTATSWIFQKAHNALRRNA